MQVNCPTCNAVVEWSETSEYRPFCSKKCQLIDLGEWAGEENTIAGSAISTPDNAPDIEDIEAMLAKQNQDFFKH